MTIIPLIAFFVLIVIGVRTGDLRVKSALIFVAVWVAGLAAFALFGLPRVGYVVVEVLLDAVLIMMIYGGDIRIR